MKIIITESQYNKIMTVFNSETGNSDYDEVLSNKTPRYHDNLTYSKVKMSPDEYYDRCSQLKGTNKEDQYNALDTVKIDRFVKMIQDGHKFNLPYIDYSVNQQEGRHRIGAVQKLGNKLVDVIIFTEKGKEDPYKVS